MANQYYPLLPKLKENSAVTPDKVSIWEDETYDFLDSLIKSLAVSGDITDMGSIDSIPDVWARPLLFEMALFDKQNTAEQQFVQGLHKRVVGEWRSLLAMLALNDIKHLNLRAQEVRINGGNDASSIERILKSLAPGKAISDDTGWDVIYVIFYREVPIAMTSPTTLVSAAADYMNAFAGNLPQPWSDNGCYLVDPIPYLTDEDLSSLYAWLQKLRENLDTYVRNKDDNEAYLMTQERIEDYCRAIGKQYRGRQLQGSYKFNEGWLKINAGLFRSLDLSIQAKEATAEESAVRIKPSRESQNGKDILLISPDMLSEAAAAWNVPMTQLVVWQGITANDIHEDSLYNGAGQLGPVILKNAEYRRPEEFFTESMAVMEPRNALKGTMKVRGEELLASENLSIVLPIRQELLEYFTTEDIADRISIENTPDEILVHFAFPLSGTGMNYRDYDYVRHYSKKELVYLQKNVPVIEIWPNIRRDGWKKYYLYYENSEAQNKESFEAGKDFFYVTPWTYGVEDSVDVPENGLANQYTARLQDFPEILRCTVNSSVQGNVRSTAVDVGMLLLDRPKQAVVNALTKWQVGIDFGTSSTMLYYKDNTQEPKPLAFEPNLFQVTESGVARNNTWYTFIPAASIQEDGSFLSIFHLLNTKKVHDVIRPLQDGHIFALSKKIMDENRMDPNTIDANLKWQSDDTGRYKATAYLEQICMQSAVEAALAGAAEVKWNFSYPAAFSDEERESFRKMCLKAIMNADEDTCFKGTPNFLDTQLESVATALHFNKLNNSDTNFGDGAICLDIGAGTTDISVISGRPGRIVYHSSIRFAGRYLFGPVYRYKYDVKDLKYDRELTGIGFAEYDADMRENSESYLEKLANDTGSDKTKEMLQKSQFGMAGIFYYVGKILAKLHEKGIYGEDHVPDIYVGGNGSRAFYWLTGGGIFDSNSVRMRVLKKMLEEASGLDNSYAFDIYLSDKPKIEVASGMIEERPRHRLFDEEEMQQNLFGDTEDEYVFSSVLCGEDYKLNGEIHDKDSFISARDISAGIEIEELLEFQGFLEKFNKNRKSDWLNGILLTDDQLREVRKRVYNYYIAEKGKDIKEIHVEPVFILALKKLMEMLIND